VIGSGRDIASESLRMPPLSCGARMSKRPNNRHPVITFPWRLLVSIQHWKAPKHTRLGLSAGLSKTGSSLETMHLDVLNTLLPPNVMRASQRSGWHAAGPSQRRHIPNAHRVTASPRHPSQPYLIGWFGLGVPCGPHPCGGPGGCIGIPWPPWPRSA
jgi:hypothetical protein